VSFIISKEFRRHNKTNLFSPITMLRHNVNSSQHVAPLIRIVSLILLGLDNSVQDANALPGDIIDDNTTGVRIQQHVKQFLEDKIRNMTIIDLILFGLVVIGAFELVNVISGRLGSE
jgi:hypothetical protein